MTEEITEKARRERSIAILMKNVKRVQSIILLANKRGNTEEEVIQTEIMEMYYKVANRYGLPRKELDKVRDDVKLRWVNFKQNKGEQNETRTLPNC